MHKPLKETIKALNRKLKGHYNYYGVTDNSKSMHAFYRQTVMQLYKTLKRRTQKHKLNWEKFYKLIEYMPIAKPQIKVNIYQ